MERTSIVTKAVAMVAALVWILGSDLGSSTAGAAERDAVASTNAAPYVASATTTPAAPGQAVPHEMIAIPAGSFTPLYSPNRRTSGTAPDSVPVASFLLDRYPVTNAEYLDFVRTHPRWSRSRVPRLFAEAGYLSHWASDQVLGEHAPENSPVTHVSWFAAKAYCANEGKALPGTAQWEYAAAASATSPNAASDPTFLRQVLEWYSKPNPEQLPPVGRGFRNVWGVEDLHGLVWEWTLDFNSALVTGESRGDSSTERDLYCGGGTLGASTFRDYAAFMRYGFRSSVSANYTVANLGFRCAQSLS